MYPSYPNSNGKSSDTCVPSATGIHTVSSSNPHPAHHHDRDKHKSIMPAAPPYNFPPSESEPWNSGICDCFSDMKSCCLTLFCPCVTFEQIAEIVDKGAISCGVNGAIYTMINCVTGCACMYSCIYRTKLRNQFYLEERPCFDCLVHFFCEPCALCQEYRELQSRGFNMAIGWRGNMEGRNYEIAMAPIPQQWRRA